MSEQNSPVSAVSFFAWNKSLAEQRLQLLNQTANSMIEKAGVVAGSAFEKHLLLIITRTLCFGTISAQYRGGDENYGLKSSDTILREIRKIAEAWKGQIDVNVDDHSATYTIHTPHPSEKPETLIFAQFVQGDKTSSTVYDEHLFMVGIMQAVRNGRDPLNSLSLLADEGFSKMNRQSPTYSNAIGPS